MSDSKCPRCGKTMYRYRRRWFERLLLVKEAYHCSRCRRRRYRPRLLNFIL